MIKLFHVKKSYKELVLFKDLNITFDKPKTKIKGLNGSGKSVLLKMIVGYSRPDSGTIYVDDKEIHKDLEFLPDAGVSINAPEFIKAWSGMENLRYLAKIRGIANDARILELALKLGLDNDLKKKYKTYSLGMRQKMRLIQALMDEPKYLILDEPFDALDSAMKKEAMDLLKEYMTAHSGTQLIYTSHQDSDDEFADVCYEINEYSLIGVCGND